MILHDLLEEAVRQAKGRAGPAPDGHKKRNTMERAIRKLKQFRAVATRYDQRGSVHLATATATVTITATALLTWLRS
ncbi:hypothetical protein A6A06_05125 [Streptomyces sp. CB02923]|uniref:hypothetical protein n=1 Tax=Streptomyces sp. CB02923 TaxID=1718985 RepID=UPI00093C7FF1|nr:hypothetical protein [Streptomyces sp. CB02923]OKI10000.1 hypothetical protein A6A06_05125 [Streptomyces sp. CB02923]